ncbi:beta carbonic anhydrase 5, chloroplastic-like isoform X4 [Malus domestica]|uniref:beta carbonic anhydrase 5, chloroplastic-like isoform X4 n=1 Tax=Malus domestica TaxID=3750 RepID=UPI0039759EE2
MLKAGREMVWPIPSKFARWMIPALVCRDSFGCCSLFSGLTNSSLAQIHRKSSFPNKTNSAQVEGIPVEFPPSIKNNPVLRPEASNDSEDLARECTKFKVENVSKAKDGMDSFVAMKERFLSFKKQKFLKESEHFQTLAQVQAPKFMVIACADSRVCPSNILGFQPGEAFMVRNVANLVPPFEYGTSETNAALEFAVNTLQVENILVIGHSSCAGIQTLLRMQDDGDSSFTQSWVNNAKIAKLRTKSIAQHLSFEQQCRHCEKCRNRSIVHC